MISLIFCGDLKYCPYLARYTERLEENKIAYRVLFWNRGNLPLNYPENYLCYDSPSDESLGKLQKLKDFIGFRKWVINQLKSYPNEGLILLSTLTGVLLFDQLHKFCTRYIFDIRDYSYENISLFRVIEKKVIDKSYFTAISSKGFKAFLPEYDYVIAHNFNRNELVQYPQFIKRGKPIKLVWNGTVRFFDYQKQYIDALKNDPRFLMVYHGAGIDLEEYKQYCESNDIKNVLFTGPYDNKDKYKLLQDADILNNCYGGRDGDELRYAISNRFYDGLIYRIPQLVETRVYKSEVVENAGVGIAIDAGSDFADKLYNYYKSLDICDFEQNCKKLLDEVIAEDDLFINKIDEFVKYN